MAFSLKHLLFAMLIVAVGLAALMNADRHLVAEFFNLLTLAVIINSGYCIWISRGEDRAFHCGFTGWAGVYFLASRWFRITVLSGTHEIIDVISRTFWPPRIPLVGLHDTPRLSTQAAWINGFHSIGHCLFALVLGLIGGWVTVHFYRKRRQMLTQRT
jgi:hypothetical protein